MGDVQGLPLGISFFAGKFSEPVLIRAAAVFEERRGTLAAPKIDLVPASSP
jgi:Asp-tRNA(Asn)/Glu-tRNA(Gln) amidotransferase A subunit family amidase